MNFNSLCRRVPFHLALLGLALWLLVNGGCSNNRDERQFGTEGTKRNDFAGEERMKEREAMAQRTRCVTYGQLRLATLDYLKRNQGAVARGRNVLLKDLANSSFDDSVIGEDLTGVNGWMVDLRGREMYKDYVFGSKRAEIYGFSVLFSAMRSRPVVEKVELDVDIVKDYHPPEP